MRVGANWARIEVGAVHANDKYNCNCIYNCGLSNGWLKTLANYTENLKLELELKLQFQQVIDCNLPQPAYR